MSSSTPQWRHRAGLASNAGPRRDVCRFEEGLCDHTTKLDTCLALCLIRQDCSSSAARLPLLHGTACCMRRSLWRAKVVTCLSRTYGILGVQEFISGDQNPGIASPRPHTVASCTRVIRQFLKFIKALNHAWFSVCWYMLGKRGSQFKVKAAPCRWFCAQDRLVQHAYTCVSKKERHFVCVHSCCLSVRSAVVYVIGGCQLHLRLVAAGYQMANQPGFVHKAFIWDTVICCFSCMFAQSTTASSCI